MKITKRIVILVLSLVMALCSTACNRWTTGDSGSDIDHTQKDTSDRSGWVLRQRKSSSDFDDKVLNIKFFNGGYGSSWIEKMEQKFEADYPGIDVKLTASENSADFQSLLKGELESDPEDIYICHDIAWETLGGANHLLADLTDDLYEATIYTDSKNNNEAIRFKDLLTPSSLRSSAFNGKYYKVAQVQGAGGILYNKTLFDKYGWKIPDTYEELCALCEQICNDTKEVAPFLVAGTEGYLWDSLIYDWFIQIAGEEEYSRMLEGNDKNCWNPDVYPYHKMAYQYWYDLFVKNKDKYMLKGFEGISNIMANAVFLAGKAAMMPATAWAVSELGSDLLKEANMDVGLIPTPYVKEAKKDKDGNFIRVCYDVAGRDSIVVAEKGNKALAVEFLKWMSETENTLIFPEEVPGMLLGFKYEIKDLLNDKYCSLTWDRDMFRLLDETTFRSTGYSTNPMFVLKLISVYPIENYYLKCFTTFGTSSQVTPDSVFGTAWTEVNDKWDTWRYEAGLA